MVNRCVLSLRLNEYKLSASRTAAGRLLHTTGPATEKAQLFQHIHQATHNVSKLMLSDEEHTTKLTFLKHHRHHLDLVRCHDNDPCNSAASTHQLGMHEAANT